jgi:hypothetical protein
VAGRRELVPGVSSVEAKATKDGRLVLRFALLDGIERLLSSAARGPSRD